MPLLKPDGSVVRRKYYDEHRHEIDKIRRSHHNAG